MATAIGVHDAKVMLSMLIEVLRGDSVAGGDCLACHRNVPLEHLIGVAADLDVRSAAVEGLHAVRDARAIVVGMTPAAAANAVAAAATAPIPLVLAWSHDTFEIA